MMYATFSDGTDIAWPLSELFGLTMHDLLLALHLGCATATWVVPEASS